jgi:GAF domain-containing protein
MTMTTPRESTIVSGESATLTAPRSPADLAYPILLETARQLGGSLEPAAIFGRLQHSVCGAMRCDGLIVSSFDRAASVILCDYAWVGGNLLDPATLPPLTYRDDSGGMQSQVIRTGRPAMFSDVVERVRDPKGTYYEVDPGGDVRDLKQGDPPLVQSAIMVPLRLDGEVVGVVQVMADAANAYASADLELLEGISLLLAVALENARLYRRAQDDLEERRRTERELLETGQALREADQRKDEFIATLGHELRNPLNPIRNAVELLRRKDTVDPDVRWGHDVIQRQVTHLTRLMDDLLDVSRIT